MLDFTSWLGGVCISACKNYHSNRSFRQITEVAAVLVTTAKSKQINTGSRINTVISFQKLFNLSLMAIANTELLRFCFN